MSSTTGERAAPPKLARGEADVAPMVAKSAGSSLPALHEPNDAVSAVVDLAVPSGLVLLVARAIWLLAHGTPVGGSIGWLVAAMAYAGRAERLRGERGAGGSALGALASALMFLLSLAK